MKGQWQCLPFFMSTNTRKNNHIWFVRVICGSYSCSKGLIAPCRMAHCWRSHAPIGDAHRQGDLEVTPDSFVMAGVYSRDNAWRCRADDA